jgi:hypothetical protein
LTLALFTVTSGLARLVALPVGLAWGVTVFCFDRGVVLGMPNYARQAEQGRPR